MTPDMRFTAQKIGKRIALIKPLVQKARHPMAEFELELLEDAVAEPGSGRSEGRVPWDSYWAGQDTNFVLRGSFEIPESYDEPALFLPLGVAGDIFTHPEAIAYIDGQLEASVDRYHQLIHLDPRLADGASHDLMLHGWTGLTSWPPDPSDPTRLLIRPCHVVDLDPVLQEFVTLSEVTLETACHKAVDSNVRERLLHVLDRAYLELDTRGPSSAAFRDTVAPALAHLRQGITSAGAPKEEVLHAIGHAHMDIAYLWPISQIRRKNARTYANVLRLMDRHPDVTFSHSQPQLYAYTKQDYPEIFDAIKARIAEGRWEVMGGMWVEADCNIPGGESLVRQIVLGRRWFEEHFGDVETPVLWLPDTFGFPWSLPQLMKQAGLDYFVTNKLNWNQYNRLPSSTTWWQGIDGSRVLAHCLTTPRDVQHLPFPTNYKSDLSADEVIGTITNARGPHMPVQPIAYGYGDGGGGPTDELVRMARAYGSMPGAPKMKMSFVREAMAALATEGEALPVWNGELYLEGHRGTYTSQGWIKRANREAEGLLHAAEAALVMAEPAGVAEETRDVVRGLWELLCLNQFHDIITGSSITAVFDDARADMTHVHRGATTLRDNALATLTDNAGSDGFSVFNAAPVTSAAIIQIDESGHGQDIDGGSLAVIEPVAAYSYAPLVPADVAQPVSTAETDSGVILENALVSLTVSPDGRLASFRDKRQSREALAPNGPGAGLWISEDRPVSWDAWDIDVFHYERAEPVPPPTSIRLVETGPLRASVRIETNIGTSRIVQHIRLTADSPRVDFCTWVDWQERHTLLRAMVPTTIHSPEARFEIQWGEVARPTHRNTSWDYARFEVPAQRWADLSERGFGLALLNDCKYGHAAHDATLEITLLKSSTSPDPKADRGEHRFTYALMPHGGDLTEVRAEARRLNHPVTVVAAGRGLQEGSMVSASPDNVIVETLKPADDGRGFILRLYESDHRRCRARLTLPSFVVRVLRTDLRERDGASLPVENGEVSFDLAPFEIVTLRCLSAEHAPS